MILLVDQRQTKSSSSMEPGYGDGLVDTLLKVVSGSPMLETIPMRRSSRSFKLLCTTSKMRQAYAIGYSGAEVVELISC